MRKRSNSKRRETVWFRSKMTAYLAGRGRQPICPHCDLPVFETDDWDECHLPHAPRAFGGGDGVEHVTVGHHRCNMLDAAQNVVPAVAKSNRIRRKHIGAHRPGMGRHPMPGGRRSAFKIAIGGGKKPRKRHAQLHADFMARRYGAFNQREA